MKHSLASVFVEMNLSTTYLVESLDPTIAYFKQSIKHAFQSISIIQIHYSLKIHI